MMDSKADFQTQGSQLSATVTQLCIPHKYLMKYSLTPLFSIRYLLQAPSCFESGVVVVVGVGELARICIQKRGGKNK